MLFDCFAMLFSAFGARISSSQAGRREELYGVVYFFAFLVRASCAVGFYSRFSHIEEKINNRAWDGRTLGFDRSALMRYLYEESFNRLYKFFQMRITLDCILIISPSIGLVCNGQITYKFFCQLVCMLVTAHLFCMSFLIHSWSLKGRYQMRLL